MVFQWNKAFGNPNKAGDNMNACAIQNDTRDMLRQMVLPLVPERRVKGALSLVSRETGLPFSKLRRLYYGITNHLLAVEWSAICAAHARWLTDQEKKLEQELEQLRELRTTRLQGRLPLNADSADMAGVVAPTTHPRSDSS